MPLIRDGFEDNMVEAKAKAKARGVRGQGQVQGQRSTRSFLFKT